MTAIALDWRRPFATYDDGRVPMYCAIVEVVGGRALTACRGSMLESDGFVSATSTTTDARRCDACRRYVMQRQLFSAIDHSAAKARRPQPPTFVEFAAGFPGFPTSLLAVSSFDDLVDSELEQLQQKAAPAVDLEPMAGPTLPRTTAIDLPFDASDIGADERDVCWPQRDGSEAKS